MSNTPTRVIDAIGFTGTQQGMTEDQQNNLRYFLILLHIPGREFHHGDCVGADFEAANIAQEIGYRVIAHPPTKVDGKPDKRAYHQSDEIRPVKPYLTRNHNIVMACQIVIAAPVRNVRPSSLRGQGTWWTITDAEKQGRSLIILSR